MRGFQHVRYVFHVQMRAERQYTCRQSCVFVRVYVCMYVVKHVSSVVAVERKGDSLWHCHVTQLSTSEEEQGIWLPGDFKR